MRNLLILSLLTLPVFSAVENRRITINYGNNLNAIPEPSGSPSPVPTEADGTPISPAKAAFIARMNAARAPPKAQWTDDYEGTCSATSQFTAEIYPLDPSNLDPGIAWAEKELDEFFNGPYPGGFTAEEQGMRLVRMDWESVNGKVKKWVEENEDQRSFLVKEGVGFFAPGTVIQFMPLFVDVEEGDECGGVYGDLERWGRDVGGVRVAGSIMGKVEDENSVTVQLRVEKLVRKGMVGEESDGRDEL